MSARVSLAIAGSIGSGKTTLTRRLSDRIGLRALYESTDDNPYLADFYRDMPRWALGLQLRFLATRVEQTRSAQTEGQSVIHDRTCYEDAEIFAANLHGRGQMTERDFETYSAIARQLFLGIEPPSLLVYLRRSVDSCLNQIKKRGRDFEKKMPRDYMIDLGTRYDEWFERYNRGPKLMVEAERYDFLESEADLESIVKRISDALPQQMLTFGV